MKKKHSEITTMHSELEAAQQRIQALEHQLAQQQGNFQTLREDHSFRKAVIERAAEGVCVCHDTLSHPFVEFTVWNYRMLEITGYTMDEINDLGWYQAMYPDLEVQQRARARMERMRQGDDLRFERWEMTRRNGEKRLVGISTSVLTASDKSVHVLGLMQDFTEEERLQTASRIDDLTQVKNRRGWNEDAGLLFKLAARQTQPITFAYLDVDNLKTVNDSLGHMEGDQVLKAVSKTLLGSVRSTDAVGRLGGDEFAFVLLNANASDAKVLVSRLHQRLLKVMRDRGWVTGVSMGAVHFSDSIPAMEDAMAYADTLMYKAKKEGKGTLLFEEYAG
ncbi:MAG: sensor domain-containing diguanylate cyclase [Anaerolineales bacterium]|nr:MAG: sensor domain-containing diguanylate cyclase [Anaerolineales bacterium]